MGVICALALLFLSESYRPRAILAKLRIFTDFSNNLNFLTVFSEQKNRIAAWNWRISTTTKYAIHAMVYQKFGFRYCEIIQSEVYARLQQILPSSNIKDLCYHATRNFEGSVMICFSNVWSREDISLKPTIIKIYHTLYRITV